jgi:two-component system phosphate regulon sensor histidine kinase PhoR
MTAVPVHELAEDVIRDFRTVAAARSVSLKQSGVDELWVMSDEQAVRTILSNLVDNAVKHTDSGGMVTVELRSEAVASYVIVRDTGEGIPEELLGRIFERFYRVEKDRSRERGGSGLGLAIVKHLCQVLKATISVRSRIGEGSEFAVRFIIGR